MPLFGVSCIAHNQTKKKVWDIYNLITLAVLKTQMIQFVNQKITKIDKWGKKILNNNNNRNIRTAWKKSTIYQSYSDILIT